jgi:hypothetical protein
VTVMSGVYGQAPDRAAFQRRVGFHAMSASSPISEDDLQAMDPEQAAQWIAGWRPEAGELMSSSRELGRTLEAVVKADPSMWGSSPLRTVALLRDRPLSLRAGRRRVS